MDTDAYFKKIVRLECGGSTLMLRVAHDLFSSHEVDEGTRVLLRSLDRYGDVRFASALDLGCGYGVIGLALRAAGRVDAVHMVDRDALAIDYARQNARLNGVDGADAYASLGYDDLTVKDFDLVASNIPGKAGEAVIAHLLLDAAHYLKPDGMVAVVVIDTIAPYVASVLEGADGVQVEFRRDSAAYSVFHYRFGPAGHDTSPTNAFDRGVYERARVDAEVAGVTMKMSLAQGLEDEDVPSPASEMLVRELVPSGPHKTSRCLVFNPGQGYAAVAIAKLLAPRAVDLVDRDLLGLRQTRLNLDENGYRGRINLHHQAGLAGDRDAGLIAGVLREEEGPAAVLGTIDAAIGRLAPGGVLLTASTSTAATRIEKHLRSTGVARVHRRKRRHGVSVLQIRR